IPPDRRSKMQAGFARAFLAGQHHGRVFIGLLWHHAARAPFGSGGGTGGRRAAGLVWAASLGIAAGSESETARGTAPSFLRHARTLSRPGHRSAPARRR